MKRECKSCQPKQKMRTGVVREFTGEESGTKIGNI